MNTRRYLYSSMLITTALVLISRILAKPAPPMPVANTAAYDDIDTFVREQMRRLKIPAIALAIVGGDEIVHLRGFGQAHSGGAPPTPQTPFFIASLTKSFTALAVMQLVEVGQINLDDPVQRYLPWFRVADARASAKMTVRHLLNQTSGLPTLAGETPLADFDQSPNASTRQARALATTKLAHPVGSTFAYSNANYNLLGLIIEAASGQLYADYIQNHIFNPLQMRHSFTSPALARRNGLAMGHQFWFAHPVAAPNMPTPYASLPSGQLISSSEDMARYMIALLNGGRFHDLSILSPAGVAELQRGAADFRAMGFSLGQYGMGWFVDQIGDQKLVWHSGTNPDFAAYMALLPGQKKGVLLLFNADHHWMNPVFSNFGASVTALLAGQQPEPVPFVGLIPWLLRGLLLIPILFVASVVATLWYLRRWQIELQRRPANSRKWGQHVVLPLLPNLLIALTLIPMLGKRAGYLLLYMPDYAWTALICGSLAVVWGFLRTGLILQAWRKAADR